MGARIERERVCRDDLEPAGIVVGNLLQRRNCARITLHRNDASSPERQQRAGEAARPGADFQHRHPCKIARRASYARGEIKVEQEILSERFLGDETMPANDFAQRRQAVRRDCHDAGTDAGLSAMASRAASRIAATKLVGSAVPVPAISNAVP